MSSVKEMAEINDGVRPDTTVVLVVGANDVVNPAAAEDPTRRRRSTECPSCDVWEAAHQSWCS